MNIKVSTKDHNYLLEVSPKELDLIACALMSYEESTVAHLRMMQDAGVLADNSLAFSMRPFYVHKAVALGKDMATIILDAWTEA